MFLKALRRWFGKPSDQSGYVYYARLRTPQGTFYKLGYTKKPSLTERMAFGGLGDERLVEKEFFFTFRKDAWDVEQKLLDHFGRDRVFGKYSNDPAMPLAGRGQSELFRRDVLGLDEDCYKISPDQIMKVIQMEQQEANDGCLMIVVGLALAPFTLGFSLLLIAGGASGIFSYGKGRAQPTGRPVHPTTIKKLVDALQGTGART